jgi:hypothetical protein
MVQMIQKEWAEQIEEKENYKFNVFSNSNV